MTHYLPHQRLIAKHPWREMNTRQKISVQIRLRTYLWRRGERKATRWVFHIRDPSALNNREEPAIRLIVSHSLWISAVPERKTIRERGGNRGQHLTWVTKVEMKCRDKKKKVQLQDVDCKGFCCYSAKGKRYGGASIESPKQVGMFRVSPPH